MSFRRLTLALLTALVFVLPAQADDDSDATITGVGFTYTKTLENAGTKSAGVRGLLLYQGKRIRHVAGDIKTPIGSFRYVHSPMLWHPSGWFRIKDLTVANIAEPVTPEMLRQGRYRGALRIGTPDNWCYLAGSNEWVDPEQLVASGENGEFIGLRRGSGKPQSETKGQDANCLLKPEPGPCKALFEKYYYDPGSKQCKPFFWGGCQGVVPFNTLEDCRQRCETR